MNATLSPALNHAIAVEMRDLADRLCKLGCALATDMAVVERHSEALQSIDLMTQIQRALADVLSGSDSIEQTLDAIPVEALAERLSAAVRRISETG